jgi:hypothetical protein
MTVLMNLRLNLAGALLLGSAIAFPSLPSPVAALPPPEEIPEEVLRTEIITEARSPLDGAPLTAAEYDQLREQLQQFNEPLVPNQIRALVFLLELRRVVKPVIPFLP